MSGLHKLYANKLDDLSTQKPPKVDRLSMADELKMLEDLWDSYGCQTISEYACEKKISRQATYSRIKTGKLPCIILGRQTFILSKI